VPRRTARGSITWLATDDAERFARVGGRFFGEELRADAVEIVDL
jgi:glutamate racemase